MKSSNDDQRMCIYRTCDIDIVIGSAVFHHWIIRFNRNQFPEVVKTLSRWRDDPDLLFYEQDMMNFIDATGILG